MESNNAELVRGMTELARLLGCSRQTAHRYKKEGKISFYQIGKKIFFDKNEVLRSLKKDQNKVSE